MSSYVGLSVSIPFFSFNKSNRFDERFPSCSSAAFLSAGNVEFSSLFPPLFCSCSFSYLLLIPAAQLCFATNNVFRTFYACNFLSINVGGASNIYQRFTETGAASVIYSRCRYTIWYSDRPCKTVQSRKEGPSSYCVQLRNVAASFFYRVLFQRHAM